LKGSEYDGKSPVAEPPTADGPGSRTTTPFDPGVVHETRESIRALGVFAGVFILLLCLHGNRLLLSTDDEGICLEAAQRMLAGQKLYVDFFAIVSPGFYWVQELSFWLLGVSMTAGRVPVLIYFAMECALIFWLTVRLSCRRAAALAVVFFVIFQTADPAVLTPQHRWDSGAICLLAIAIAIHGQCEVSPIWIAVSGALFGLATIFTPTVALVGAATFLWLSVRGITRPLLLPFLSGCAVMTGVLLLAMWKTGILAAFAQQMLWLSRNYSAVNVMPYGAIIGGYGRLLAGEFNLEWILRLVIVICLAMPAILPIASILGWIPALWLQRNRPSGNGNAAVIYMLICMAALVVTTYPRSDVAHLAYVVPISYALTASFIFWYVPQFAFKTLFVTATFIGTLLCLHTSLALIPQRRVSTPVGILRVSATAVPEVESLLERVKRGDVLFVHPSKPLLYFLTQAKNPTRYSHLAPGMMNNEERVALAGLYQNAPQWVLHLDVDRGDFLRVFPSGDPSTMQYKSIEHWIHERYTPVNPPVIVSGYQLYQANAGPPRPNESR
jgi:hypothetical protein